jgi:TetR/AcrR family transcriptional regulator, transcriptional repressor of bet genes
LKKRTKKLLSAKGSLVIIDTIQDQPQKERVLRQRQRLRLIEACISALHQYGPSRTTIDKVVTIAEMSPGIVNFYFDTKAALLVAALDHLAVEFEKSVLAPVEALRATPARALEQLITLYLDPAIASPRKVSVWYSFWGEASARSEYLAICGKRDVAFSDLVRGLMDDLIAARGDSHLNADAVALGLVGALEMTWQDIAFREEDEIDRDAARARCLAYLDSVFPPKNGEQRAEAQHLAEACRMLAAAELGLAGHTVLRVPDGWPDYHLVVQRPGLPPLTVRVARPGTVAYRAADRFDFLAVVAPNQGKSRAIYVVPRHETDRLLPGDHGMHLCPTRGLDKLLGPYKGDFKLSA